jgi:hypothetical protein
VLWIERRVVLWIGRRVRFCHMLHILSNSRRILQTYLTRVVFVLQHQETCRSSFKTSTLCTSLDRGLQLQWLVCGMLQAGTAKVTSRSRRGVHG